MESNFKRSVKLGTFLGTLLFAAISLIACSADGTKVEADEEEIIETIHEGDVDDSWYDYELIVDTEEGCEYFVLTDGDDQMSMVPRYTKVNGETVIKGCK